MYYFCKHERKTFEKFKFLELRRKANNPRATCFCTRSNNNNENRVFILTTN